MGKFTSRAEEPLGNQFQKWSNCVPLIGQKNIFLSAQSARRSSQIALSPSYIHEMVFCIHRPGAPPKVAYRSLSQTFCEFPNIFRFLFFSKKCDGIQDLTAPREAELAKIWAWNAGFFACLLRVGKSSPPFYWPKPLVSPFKPNYRVCQINSYLIETVMPREYFVSTRCQKSPCGIIAYQLICTSWKVSGT